MNAIANGNVGANKVEFDHGLASLKERGIRRTYYS